MEAALVQGCTLIRAKSILSSNRCQNLTSLDDRIAEFIVDRFPDEGSPVELLCVDHGALSKLGVLCGTALLAARRLGESNVVLFECSVHDGRPHLEHEVCSSR